jgi:hypothetical protein
MAEGLNNPIAVETSERDGTELPTLGLGCPRALDRAQHRSSRWIRRVLLYDEIRRMISDLASPESVRGKRIVRLA